MLLDIKGDMLRIAPKGALIGIPVNTVAVGGKGLARYMKVRWPAAYKRYCKDCRKGKIASGDLCVYDVDDYRLAMLPTKYYWGNPSDLGLIKITAVRLLKYMQDNLDTVAYVPRLGCGVNTGMLDYGSDVRPILVEVFNEEVPEVLQVFDW
jgi:hypothetical protein